MVEEAGNERLLLVSSRNPNQPRTVDLRFQEYVLTFPNYTERGGKMGAVSGVVWEREGACANIFTGNSIPDLHTTCQRAKEVST